MERQIPQINPFKPVRFPDYELIRLDNGIPVYILPSEGYEVFKMEIHFRAGRIFEKQPGTARATAQLLRDGTHRYDSARIAEEVDFYGASLHTTAGMDFARLEWYSLRKYAEKLLPLIGEMLRDPLFEEKELASYRQRNIQNLQIDLAKNDVLSYRVFTEALYGPGHPYGYNSDRKTYEQLNPETLRHHFNRCILDNIHSIILAGGIDEHLLTRLNSELGQRPPKNPFPDPALPDPVAGERYMHRTGEQKFQASVKLGRRLFNRNHPDYPALYVLNTLLGGFFGSRLMQNIREEKGLTYDIYSTLDMLLLDGFLMIGAEVDNENVETTLHEIHEEFRILREELIGKEELNLVKNYINGNLLNLMNGPFNSIELMRLVAKYGQEKRFFDFFMEQIHGTDAESIRMAAQKYLDPSDFITVVVGNGMTGKI